MRVLDQGEEPMNRLPVQKQRSSEHLRPRSASGQPDWRSEPAHSIGESDGRTLRPGLQLPPTRAALPTRSRGVFLAAPRWVLDSLKSRRGTVSRVTLALAAVAATSALVVCSPSVVVDTTHAASRGLALVGAASAPPSFMAPAKKQ